MNRILLFLLLMVLFACKGNENKSVSDEPKDSTRTETGSAVYTCPMHPEVTSDKPGECPHCGMELQVKS